MILHTYPEAVTNCRRLKTEISYIMALLLIPYYIYIDINLEHLDSEYYGYSMIIDNWSVKIYDIPGNLYHHAEVLWQINVAGIGVIIMTHIIMCNVSEYVPFALLHKMFPITIAISTVVVILINAYYIWYLTTLSNEIITLWRSIDPLFVDIYYHIELLIICHICCSIMSVI